MKEAEEREALLEAAVTAHRDRDASGRILPSPAWMDLAPADREAAFEAQSAARRLEAAHDENGMNATAWVVTERANWIAQM